MQIFQTVTSIAYAIISDISMNVTWLLAEVFFYRDHCVSCTAIDRSENYQDKAVVVFTDVTLNTGNAYSATTG